MVLALIEEHPDLSRQKALIVVEVLHPFENKNNFKGDDFWTHYLENPMVLHKRGLKAVKLCVLSFNTPF